MKNEKPQSPFLGKFLIQNFKKKKKKKNKERKKFKRIKDIRGPATGEKTLCCSEPSFGVWVFTGPNKEHNPRQYNIFLTYE